VIRPITPDDDLDAQLDLGQHAFGRYSAAQRASWLQVARLRAEQGLFFGAFIDGRPAGAAMLHEMRQWWLGRAVPCAGVASVKVAPEDRGRGIGRRLMTVVLDVVAERGYPLSVLCPATMPIYRSLGWELAGARYEAVIPPRSLRALTAPDAHAGHDADVDADAGADAGDGAPRAALRRAGTDDAAAVIRVTGRAHLLARDAGPITWDEAPTRWWLGRDDLYSYLAGEDGFAAYRWAEGNRELFVERVHAATPAALRSLWSVIASHGSVARTVRALVAPGDPLWWLTPERDAALAKRSQWMLRVVDAPAAIAARGFPAAVAARLPLEISDPARPANSGRWELTVADGQATLIPNGPSRSPAPPDSDPDPGRTGSGDGAGSGDSGAGDSGAGGTGSGGGAGAGGAGAGPLRLGARGFAALYAGIPLPTLRLAGLAAGGSAAADAAFDAAFAASPYMVDDF
jgi:predicted N-acetyltransferase YhbS